MFKTAKKLAISTAFAMVVIVPAYAQAETPVPDEALVMVACEDQFTSGQYIAKHHPSFAPITAEQLNQAIGEDLVATVRSLSTNLNLLIIVPENPKADCTQFMNKLKDTGLFEYIQPDYIVTIQPLPPITRPGP